ncbi:Vesicle transport protein GOT1B [Blattella germanica]|nr:Vesicle transport protein GOT1B [Blattella germanica]
MFEITDVQKIGVGLAGFGVSFLFLGVLLLFDKGLLAIGNILFIAGLACVIGLERTFRFFFQKHKVKASISFFGGIIVVLGFFPVAINFLRRVPVLGTFLNFPGIRGLVDRLAGDSSRTTV